MTPRVQWIAPVAVVAIGAFLWWRADHLAARLEMVSAERAQVQQQLAGARASLAWQVGQHAQLLEALEEREVEIKRAHQTIEAHRKAAARMEVDDGEAAKWAAGPVPGAVRDWLRDLPGTGDGGGGPGAEPPGRADPRAVAGDPEQP